MAVITCTRSNLITAGKCLTESVWSQKEQDALMVYLMAQLLAEASGTNYTSTLSTTLLSDAEDVTCGMTADQMEASALAIVKAFAGSTKTTDQLADEIKCLKNATKLQLDQAKLHLLCALSNVLTYSD